MSGPTERNDCPLCSGSSLRGRFVLGHREWVRCADCGHDFGARFDEAALAAEYRAAYYDGADDPRIDAWAQAHRAVWDAAIAQIVELQPKLRRVLDIGAGSGGFLACLRAKRPDVELLASESSEAARAALRRQLPGIRFPVGEAEWLDVHDAAGSGGPGDARVGSEGTADLAGSCDVVTLMQTLEHLAEPLRVCRGARACLRPGGLLFITVPNRRSLGVLLRGRRADCYANGTHLHAFDRRSLTRLLQQAGFVGIRRLVGFGGGQCASPPAAVAQYLLRRTGWSSELRVVAFRP